MEGWVLISQQEPDGPLCALPPPPPRRLLGKKTPKQSGTHASISMPAAVPLPSVLTLTPRTRPGQRFLSSPALNPRPRTPSPSSRPGPPGSLAVPSLPPVTLSGLEAVSLSLRSAAQLGRLLYSPN